MSLCADGCSSHPIEVPVGHPDEVEEIFDAISYEKGASVIRMLFDYLGEDVGFFDLGLFLYGDIRSTFVF